MARQENERKINWPELLHRLSVGRIWAMPGLAVVAVVMLARLTGTLQYLEWLTFDLFLRFRPPEPIDDRIVIVSIDEADLERIGTYPIPPEDLVTAIQVLEAAEPAVVGLNMLPDVLQEADNSELMAIGVQKPNLIATERAFPPELSALDGFSLEQIGFSDILPDGDGRFRRILLGMNDPVAPTNPNYLFSFTIRLVNTYLSNNHPEADFGNGVRDPEAMRFGDTELPRFLPTTGGYAGSEEGGVQLLMNFRAGQSPFTVISFQDVLDGAVSPERLRDRIVILGVMQPQVRPPLPTLAVKNADSRLGQISGSEYQAHAVSQILSAVLDDRPLLRSWSESWEYLWILGWGLIGMTLCQQASQQSRKFIDIAIASSFLIIGSYLILALWAWWIPVVPPLIALIFNGVGYAAFYKYDRRLKAKLDESQNVLNERQKTIERTFDIIHNGPLQTLANLLRHLRDEEFERNQVVSQLEELNLEIRRVGDHLKNEAMTQETSLLLQGGVKLDLNLPLHQLFYEVYNHTLMREFVGFKTLKVKVRAFDPIDDEYLTLELKRDLCRFLEEAICNIGKHAKEPTRIKVQGISETRYYTIKVEDNGLIQAPGTRVGDGTQNSHRLSQRLRGTFRRETLDPKGMVCELTWPKVQISRYWGLFRAS